MPQAVVRRNQKFQAVSDRLQTQPFVKLAFGVGVWNPALKIVHFARDVNRCDRQKSQLEHE